MTARPEVFVTRDLKFPFVPGDKPVALKVLDVVDQLRRLPPTARIVEVTVTVEFPGDGGVSRRLKDGYSTG